MSICMPCYREQIRLVCKHCKQCPHLCQGKCIKQTMIKKKKHLDRERERVFYAKVVDRPDITKI